MVNTKGMSAGRAVAAHFLELSAADQERFIAWCLREAGTNAVKELSDRVGRLEATLSRTCECWGVDEVRAENFNRRGKRGAYKPDLAATIVRLRDDEKMTFGAIGLSEDVKRLNGKKAMKAAAARRAYARAKKNPV